jgi:uncharacterized protein involved in cysteine biosynthesis
MVTKKLERKKTKKKKTKIEKMNLLKTELTLLKRALRLFSMVYASAFYRLLILPTIPCAFTDCGMTRGPIIMWLNVSSWLMYLPYVFVEIYLWWENKRENKWGDTEAKLLDSDIKGDATSNLRKSSK